MSDTYSFARTANRLVAVELTKTGTVRPFVRRKNSAGKFVDDGPSFKAITLAGSEKAQFQVTVPFVAGLENWGTIAHEFADWGPGEEYLTAHTYILGKTWPFAQEPFGLEFTPTGSNPGTGSGSTPMTTIGYTFKKQGTNWSLSWSAKTGLSEQTGSVNLSKNAGAIYVVLRSTGTCSGQVKFLDRAFGPKKQTMFFAEPDPVVPAPLAGPATTLRTLSAPLVSSPAIAAAAADSELTQALRAIYQRHQAQWQAALDARIPDEYLDPIRRAIGEHATQATLGLLGRTPGGPGLRALSGTEAACPSYPEVDSRVIQALADEKGIATTAIRLAHELRRAPLHYSDPAGMRSLAATMNTAFAAEKLALRADQTADASIVTVENLSRLVSKELPCTT